MQKVEIPEWIAQDSQVCEFANGHEWSIARLITLVKELPVFDAPLCALDLAVYYKNLSLREMVMHFQAMENADLDFPIIMDEDGLIMDGRHRIMKALIEGKTTIKAVRFKTNPTPDRTSAE